MLLFHLVTPTPFHTHALLYPRRALTLQPGNCQALVRRAQAHEELGRFLLAVEDLEAAEASVSADNNAGAEDLAGELQEISRRLEHARWTKVRNAIKCVKAQIDTSC